MFSIKMPLDLANSHRKCKCTQRYTIQWPIHGQFEWCLTADGDEGRFK